MRPALLLAILVLLPRAGRAAGPPPPHGHEDSYAWDIVHHSVIDPLTRALDPPQLLRNATGTRREAENVDANDQVRLPSTWWQPRLGFRRVTVEQMMKGPGPGLGPADGPWTITHAKDEGVTPGFQIKDARGDRFLIKFDLPGNPELCTSADVVGCYLFWAAGYNVPENTIAFFRAESLRIDPDAVYTDARGRHRRFTREHLDAMLARVARQRDGRYRVAASRYLEGKPIGPFRYSGRRRDDPEDLVPHELRRELRGLWTIAAWTNHCDVRSANTLDTWVTAGERSFVRHHLLDFGAILGAGPGTPRSPVSGTEYYVDPAAWMPEIATLGLKRFRWEAAPAGWLKSEGQFEAVSFDPEHWKPDYPNPAFIERTPRDVRWGARIVAAFSDEHIRAAVRAGNYSDPRVADDIARVLMARRDMIVQAWLGGAGAPGRTP